MLKEILSSYAGKSINIIMDGGGGAHSGKLLVVADAWIIMETRWSDKQYFDLTKVSSFWCPDDKKDK